MKQRLASFVAAALFIAAAFRVALETINAATTTNSPARSVCHSFAHSEAA